MENEITKMKFCAMTVAQANKIASQHENNPDWDFWKSQEDIDDPESKDNDSLARQ